METSDPFSDVAEFFNIEFGSDYSNLKKIQDVLDRLSKYEEELEYEISPHNRDPAHVVNAMKSAEEALKRIRDLKGRWDQLEISVSSEIEKRKPLKDDFYSKIKELKTIETLNCYLNWVLKIENEKEFQKI